MTEELEPCPFCGDCMNNSDSIKSTDKESYEGTN